MTCCPPQKQEPEYELTPEEIEQEKRHAQYVKALSIFLIVLMIIGYLVLLR